MQDIICKAIQERRIIQFQYGEQPVRTVEPHQIGCRPNYNDLELSAYHIEGYSESGNWPPWRTFKLAKIRNVKIAPPGTFSVRRGYVPGPNGTFDHIVCEA